MEGVMLKRPVVAVNSCNTIQTLLDINAMIDIHAKHLEGLRYILGIKLHTILYVYDSIPVTKYAFHFLQDSVFN